MKTHQLSVCLPAVSLLTTPNMVSAETPAGAGCGPCPFQPNEKEQER